MSRRTIGCSDRRHWRGNPIITAGIATEPGGTLHWHPSYLWPLTGQIDGRITAPDVLLQTLIDASLGNRHDEEVPLSCTRNSNSGIPLFDFEGMRLRVDVIKLGGQPVAYSRKGNC